MGYWQYMHVTYVRKYIEEGAGIRAYSLVQKVHDNHQWYAKVSFHKDEGTQLLQRYPFVTNYNTWVLAKASKPQNDFIKDCADCQYYLETTGHGIYGYTLYCLSGNKQQLELYEQFGD